jgi:hypothetical protein
LRRRRPAFTLIEILVVVGLTGLIAVTAFTPLVHTVGLLRDLELSFGREAALRVASSRIVDDMRQYQEGSRAPAVRLVRHDRLGGVADDVLLFWSVAPLRQGRPAGTIVYRLGARPGREKSLLRWTLPGLRPGEINPAGLDEEEAQLVLQGLDGFRVAFLQDRRWVDEYGGGLPRAIRLTLTRGEVEGVYEDWLPQAR